MWDTVPLTQGGKPYTKCVGDCSAEGLFLNAHRPDTSAIVAAVAARADAARIEVQVARVEGTARVERARPIVAVAARTVETRVVAVARSGQKD